MLFSPLIWKKHKARGWDNTCPHCQGQLKWIYDGITWYPCDAEPVLFRLHPEGRSKIVYKRRLIENCIIYTPEDKKGDGAPLWGYQQHYYTCPVLRKHRQDYAKKRRLNYDGYI